MEGALTGQAEVVGGSKGESGLECPVARGGGRPPAGLVRTDEGEDASSPETQKSLTQGPMAVASAVTTSASSLTQVPTAGGMAQADVEMPPVSGLQSPEPSFP